MVVGQRRLLGERTHMDKSFPVDEFLGELVPTTKHTLVFDGVEITADFCDESLAVIKSVMARDGMAPELLRAMFAPVVAITEEAEPESPEPPQEPATPPVAVEVDTAEVRRWAKTQASWKGRVKDRGQLSPALIADYMAAHQVQSK